MLKQFIKLKPSFGVSLVEILIAVAIGAMLMTVVLSSAASFRDARLIDAAVDAAVSSISSARAKTMNSENASQYGVHLESSDLVLFKGATYNQADAYNKVVALSSLVEIANVALAGGGSDIVFKRLNGRTDNGGYFVVRLKSNNGKYKTISIGSTGVLTVK